ncbi:MAG: hypothetical protein ACKOGM_00315, partial [Solirubrobacterales bacterium]
QPALKIGVLETKSVEGLLEVLLPASISSELVTWFGFVLAGLTASFVIITGLAVPKERSLKASIAAGLVIAAMLLLAWVVSEEGVLTGIATGLIMFVSSLAARQTGPLGTMGALAGTLYFLFAILGVTDDLKGSGITGAGIILELSLVGKHEAEPGDQLRRDGGGQEYLEQALHALRLEYADLQCRLDPERRGKRLRGKRGDDHYGEDPPCGLRLLGASPGGHL